MFVLFRWCFAFPIHVMVAFTTSMEVPQITNYIFACRKNEGGGRSVNIIFSHVGKRERRSVNIVFCCLNRRCFVPHISENSSWLTVYHYVAVLNSYMEKWIV